MHTLDVDVRHREQLEQNLVKEMLSLLSSMWTGQLGKVNMNKHVIDVPKGTKPHRSLPYRAGFKYREREEEDVKHQLKLLVIEPSQSELDNPVLLVPKLDGMKRFCIDY